MSPPLDNTRQASRCSPLPWAREAVGIAGPFGKASTVYDIVDLNGNVIAEKVQERDVAVVQRAGDLRHALRDVLAVVSMRSPTLRGPTLGEYINAVEVARNLLDDIEKDER